MPPKLQTQQSLSNIPEEPSVIDEPARPAPAAESKAVSEVKGEHPQELHYRKRMEEIMKKWADNTRVDMEERIAMQKRITDLEEAKDQSWEWNCCSLFYSKRIHVHVNVPEGTPVPVDVNAGETTPSSNCVIS